MYALKRIGYAIPMKSILIKLNACCESIAWVEKNKIETIADAWAKCERGDWMLWLAEKRGLDRKKLVFIVYRFENETVKVFESTEI